ncbi:DUF6114 domain-containing protein [Streptacidiphilus sp. P02-A3a]|uniref:DUF6114 domain-containing protein n=1 Tax=Streptacidiphilus sp. P02-A3a TaxID=2704468 RepID=UPI0015F80531|nr:DUF6114 domain-containing protein [Streptacidiphilus sp. P02-A3a]QMU72493.1 hypothetical protein GXP74_33860 [Streptacidiphilus sp. P02-A3a]
MTSATAQARPEPANGFSKARQAFRNWRHSRPFWGGLLVLLAGLPIIYFPYANLNIGTLSLHLATSAGAASLLIGLLLMALGISAWFQPHVRVFAGIAALVLTLVSIPMSNLGGFGMGLIPGLLGGTLLCSWAPLKEPTAAELVESDAEAEGAAEAEEWGESPVPGFAAEAPEAPTVVHQREPEHEEPQEAAAEGEHHGE